jgi:hypothetical protein
MRRRPNIGEAGSPFVFSLQIIPGANRLEEGIPGIIRLPSLYGEGLEKRVSDVFAKLLYPRFNDTDLKLSIAPPYVFGTTQGSPHIVRLAYAGEIARKVAAGETVTGEEIEQARELRIVTPLTGAVVLESMEQFVRHGLDPSSASQSVPTIPEPEEYALMAVVCALLASAFLKDRASRRASR